MKNDFDRLAKPYRWMEYITFGRVLERCRFMLLPQVATAKNALLLGDGDGRFAARLLKAAPDAHLTAVDASEVMLQAVQRRCLDPDRVSTYDVDLARDSLVPLSGKRFDLVASHFFMDCLSTAECEVLVPRIRDLLVPGARWINSEFQIPRGAARVPALIVVRLLYAAFGVLTGLRVRHLPEYGRVLQDNGFMCTTRIPLLCGLLISEEWMLQGDESGSGLQ